MIEFGKSNRHGSWIAAYQPIEEAFCFILNFKFVLHQLAHNQFNTLIVEFDNTFYGVILFVYIRHLFTTSTLAIKVRFEREIKLNYYPLLLLLLL